MTKRRPVFTISSLLIAAVFAFGSRPFLIHSIEAQVGDNPEGARGMEFFALILGQLMAGGVGAAIGVVLALIGFRRRERWLFLRWCSLALNLAAVTYIGNLLYPLYAHQTTAIEKTNIMEPEKFITDIERLRRLGWSCHWQSQPMDMPAEVYSRYPWLPSDYLDFVRGLDECINADETQWILTPSDFDSGKERVWRHDEWEQLSLESADGDADLIAEIRKFWDAHIPISLGLSGGYSFYALRVGDRSGAVVSGREPEFEEVTEVASNFTQFLAQLDESDNLT